MTSPKVENNDEEGKESRSWRLCAWQEALGAPGNQSLT